MAAAIFALQHLRSSQSVQVSDRTLAGFKTDFVQGEEGRLTRAGGRAPRKIPSSGGICLIGSDLRGPPPVPECTGLWGAPSAGRPSACTEAARSCQEIQTAANPTDQGSQLCPS